MTKATVKSAWETALKLLSGRDYSRHEMAAKLAQRGFDEAEAVAALDKLEHYGYIVATGTDVGKLAQMAAQYLAKKKNPASPGALRSLEAFLLRKGFDPDLVAAHMECGDASPLFSGAARRAVSPCPASGNDADVAEMHEESGRLAPRRRKGRTGDIPDEAGPWMSTL